MECSSCCGNCGSCENIEKRTERSLDDKKALIKRLNIIEGQIRGISQMIENDRYCGDILIQVAAVNKGLKSFGNQLLEKHLKSCVAYDVQMGNLDILDEVTDLIKRLQ